MRWRKARVEETLLKRSAAQGSTRKAQGRNARLARELLPRAGSRRPPRGAAHGRGRAERACAGAAPSPGCRAGRSSLWCSSSATAAPPGAAIRHCPRGTGGRRSRHRRGEPGRSDDRRAELLAEEAYDADADQCGGARSTNDPRDTVNRDIWGQLVCRCAGESGAPVQACACSDALRRCRRQSGVPGGTAPMPRTSG